MEKQQLAVKEQIVKTVVKSGNGGAVWVPKSWLGEEVVIIRPEKQKYDLQERVIHMLEPYLKDIISVGIYGSYARHEQMKESDIDVLVITKDKNLKLDFKKEKIDIISLSLNKLKKAIKKYPARYYQIVQEAEPLINAYVLQELKKMKIHKESFKEYLRETREHLKSNKQLLELDKIGSVYLQSYSVMYSIILRLRGLYIIKCIIKNEKFSNKKFKEWFIGQNITPKEYEESYRIYRSVRDDENIKNLRIKIESAEKMMSMLEREVKMREAQLYGK